MSGATTPAAPPSIQILAFQGIGNFYPSFAVFTPTDPPATAYNPFTPGAFSAQSAALQSMANNGLGSIQALGAAEFSTIAGLFATWGQSQANFMTTAGDSLSIVARNSAKACTSFFDCIF